MVSTIPYLMIWKVKGMYVVYTCLHDPTHWIQMPREREKKWVFQLSENEKQSLQQYQSSDHKAMLEREEAVQRDLEKRDRMHTSGGEIIYCY